MSLDPEITPPQKEYVPALNVPTVVAALIVAMISVHVFRVWLLPKEFEQDFLLLFAAIPARYGESGGQFPFPLANWYTPLSYSFLHGDWTHIIFNLLWMLAFGSPVAVRFGTIGFLALFVAGAVSGFAAHLVTHIDSFGPMVGASGAVSAFMGTAIRLGRDVHQPVLSLKSSFQNRGFLAFVGIWFAVNFLIAQAPGLVAAEDAQIAWQAHVGGFLVGLLGFHLFDLIGAKAKKSL